MSSLIRTITFISLIILYVQTEACKLYCEECPANKDLQQYYCCQDDHQSAPVIKSCKEWICPTGAIRRPASVGALNMGPVSCDTDIHCPDIADIRMKCCYDSAINGKVCKPAIEKI